MGEIREYMDAIEWMVMGAMLLPGVRLILRMAREDRR